MNEIEEKEYLEREGDKLYADSGRRPFFDDEFIQQEALDGLEGDFNWERINELTVGTKGRAEFDSRVFDNLMKPCHMIQGDLGDCYLISAMTVISHIRPKLL
mmetsp:Transcript_11662/g.11585  ORF Transcript_11662/g.11585 Transcript_11662/m.11585 type:complete len:102 (+) Transcript_11662:503-808(+)|eukprot:CAMPEP_0170561978 /NCGR_PEP_ID=MMETSP0211-20121228/58065_1 /TAXON_ID=311385 /ORGANISM="Pseudokeronopsis sp., Strain OXSARD2" /LENGTH=101 /DNA_ID=CAMNT_0010878239 /DNA_START=482 /DNA_END=787 /DNA_ORIENTATION=+